MTSARLTIVCVPFEPHLAYRTNEQKKVNMFFMTSQQQASVAHLNISAEEQAKVDYAAAWATTGNAYAVEHGTRPSTISLVLQTNPVAMLAWYEHDPQKICCSVRLLCFC